MNEVLMTLETRRSCRRYKEEAVPADVIAEVVKAGMYAPTGMGQQSPIIIEISNKELRDAMAIENRKYGPFPEGFDPFYGAPTVLVVLADKNAMTYVNDGTLVAGNMLNAAASLGLGSCWVHRAGEVFASEFGQKILKDLGIEGDYEGIGNVILGYSAEDIPSEPAPRKDDYFYSIR